MEITTMPPFLFAWKLVLIDSSRRGNGPFCLGWLIGALTSKRLPCGRS